MEGKKLQIARQKLGKTQLQIANEVGIAKNAYYRYEQGKVLPNVIIGNSIAKALNTTAEHLWGYKTVERL